MAGLAAPARLPKLPFQSSAYAFGLRRAARAWASTPPSYWPS